MTQAVFPSTISTQSPSIGFLTIKTMVRENPSKQRSHGVFVLGQARAWTKGGGG